jgi:hypothetical protein
VALGLNPPTVFSDQRVRGLVAAVARPGELVGGRRDSKSAGTTSPPPCRRRRRPARGEWSDVVTGASIMLAIALGLVVTLLAPMPRTSRALPGADRHSGFTSILAGVPGRAGPDRVASRSGWPVTMI